MSTPAFRTPATRPCDSCAFRRSVPGSTHSRCIHPAVAQHKAPGPDGLVALFAILLPGALPPATIPGIKVEGHPHGVRSGWFAWPHNFDPTWLLSCDGYNPASPGGSR